MLIISLFVSLILGAVKGFLKLTGMFLRLFGNIWKLLYCFFPAVAVTVVILFGLEGASVYTGRELIPEHISDISSIITHAEEAVAFDPDALMNDIADKTSGAASDIAERAAQKATDAAEDIASKTAKNLAARFSLWWNSLLKKSVSRINRLIILGVTVLTGIPVSICILAVSAIWSGREILAIAFITDLVLYFLGTLFTGRSPLGQFCRRRHILFGSPYRSRVNPEYEQAYADWLKRHHVEFEDDSYGQPCARSQGAVSNRARSRAAARRRSAEEFYEDDEDDITVHRQCH
jgi:hypothetical protein